MYGKTKKCLEKRSKDDANGRCSHFFVDCVGTLRPSWSPTLRFFNQLSGFYLESAIGFDDLFGGSGLERARYKLHLPFDPLSHRWL
jgi:hypothetical protein